MYIVFKQLHSLIAYFTLALLIISIIYNTISWQSKKPFTKRNKIMAMQGLISVHIQLLIGLVLYFLSPLGSSNMSGEAMKNAMSRLFVLEHPLTMIIAIALITFGYSKAKRLTEDNLKYKKIVLFYTMGLLLIILRIPWNVWF